MSIAAEVAAHLPFLRRYARALTGSQELGDAIVAGTLQAALADASLAEQLREGRVPLYRAFTQAWKAKHADAATAGAQPQGQSSGTHEAGAQHQLGLITPTNRQALLLTTVEDFTNAEAAGIMELDEAEIEALVKQAIAEIERETTTKVLIIEDEPLISMQLEDLVRSLGHEICGTAATRTQAQKVAQENPPGLVLADIQLADGSSGLDAVDDILEIDTMPVIFITAYPERLLTGNRPEPTYLITKPFQESTVRAAISQALFFRSSRPLD